MAISGKDVRDLVLRVDADTEAAKRNMTELRGQLQRQFAAVDGDLTRLDSAFTRMGGSIRTVTDLIGAFGVALGAAALVQAGRAAVDYAANLALTARQLGVTVEQLQILDRTARENSVVTDDMRAAVGRFNQELVDAQSGARGAVQAFRDIGITPEQLAGFRQGGDALREVAQRIASIEDPTRRAAAAQQLFGREGQEIARILTAISTGYGSAAERARQMGILTDEQAEKARAARVQFEELADTLKTQLALAVIDNIEPIRQLGDAFVSLIDNLRTIIPLATAFAGIALGSRFGPWGAAVGGVAGFAVGRNATGANNVDIQEQRAAARAAWTQRYMELRRQGLTRAEVNAMVPNDPVLRASARLFGLTGADQRPPAAVDIPVLPASGAGGGGGGGRRGSGRAARPTPREPAPWERRLGNAAYDDALNAPSFVGNLMMSDVELEFLDGARSRLEAMRTELQAIAKDMPNLGEMLPSEDLERLERFRLSFFDDVSRGLARAIVQGDNLGDALVNAFARAGEELIASGIFDLLSGNSFGRKKGGAGFLSFLGNLFGGFRAGGGDILPGKFYVAGERGPEIIVPKVPGVVIPNGGIGGGQRLGSSEVHVFVHPSQEFDVRIERVSGAVVASAAPKIAASGAGMAIKEMTRPRL